MSFGFQFEEDEIDEEYKAVDNAHTKSEVEERYANDDKEDRIVSAKRHSLRDLLCSLPPRISFSRIEVPLHNGQKTTMYRRDLFDARFQLMTIPSEEEVRVRKDEYSKKIDATPPSSHSTQHQIGSNTDLISGVYEGGFKTWECSLDLVAVLHARMQEEHGNSWLKRKQIIELGCGTALPSIYLLSQMIKAESECDCVLKLCDFNEQVLSLVTLPNLILTWYFSKAEADSSEQSGELDIGPDIVQDFMDALDRRMITIDFYSGLWQTLHSAGAFDISHSSGSLVLTSETIYSLRSLPHLVDTLEKACHHSLETKMERQSLCDEAEEDRSRLQHLCLVAAKKLYFGVGGGIEAFIREAEKRQASCNTVWQSQRGVARAVLEVKFT